MTIQTPIIIMTLQTIVKVHIMLINLFIVKNVHARMIQKMMDS